MPATKLSKPEGREGELLDLTRPKLDLISWGFVGGFFFRRKWLGSARGTLGIAMVILPLLRTAADPTALPVTIAFMIVGLLLILSGYNSYSKAYDKATENAKTRHP